MNAFHKALQMNLLLCITLSLVAGSLVFLKVYSTGPNEPASGISGSTLATVGKSPQYNASENRGRQNHSRPTGIPPLPPVSHKASSILPQRSGPCLPPSPSETATTFQAGRAKLMREHQQLMRHLAHASTEEPNQSMEKWHEEHAGELIAQQQLAMKMGAESHLPMLRVASAPRVPFNATPELREFLTARHQTMKDHAEMLKQLQNVTPEERHRAMKGWQEKNAIRCEAILTAATQLAGSHSPANLPKR